MTVPSMPPDDADRLLLRRVASGQKDALGELASRYEPMLLGLATGLLGGRSDLARDAVQDAWVRVIRHAHGFQERSSVKTWLYRIVINRCKDLRARRTFAPLADEPSDAAGAGNPATPTGPQAMVSDERSAALRRALAGLPGPTRLVILLCYHQGLTHEQAAEVLEIPTGTLKSRLNAALTELRSQLRREDWT
jgi:RNA polymerase sigma-70 factor (ECF subfamily)